MNNKDANALLFEIKDAITDFKQRGYSPAVVLIDAALLKRLELGLDCGTIDAISKIPVCPMEKFKLGWKVVEFSGGVV